MNETSNENELNANVAFDELKKKYRTKVKSGENDDVDDIKYLAAKEKEKARLKRLQDDFLRFRSSQLVDDSDEVVESDDGLFLSSFPTQSSTTKRSHELAAGSKNPMEEVSNEMSPTKKQATKAKREQAKQYEKELQFNRLAGVEQILRAQQKKDAKDAAAKEREEQKAQQQAQSRSKSTGRKASKAKAAASKPKGRPGRPKNDSSKSGYIDDLRTLGFYNIYDEANANSDKSSGPIDNATRKKDALKGLMASIPVEDRGAAKRDRNHILKSTRTLGFRAVRPDGEGHWKMKGVTSSLYHHQIQAAAEMRERETGFEPYGGLLCDDMGLGKTVTTIAAMVANRPTTGDHLKTTLIVVTPSLVGQWMAELEKHIEPGVFPSVIKYHGSSKIVGNGALHVMRSMDVILTTYGEVMNSYPKFEPPDDMKSLEEKLSWWDDIWEKTRGNLHRVYFHRVVLDEAHGIKNHTAQTSVSCRALMAKNRWAISGTPIHNGVFELYPYFKFLREPHTGSFDIFQKNFCVAGDEDCRDRLHTFLKQFMIRRTHATQICGKPLIQLPRNHQRTYYVEFNRVERRLYDMVHKRYVQAINLFAMQSSLDEKHNIVLTMLLRLRQLTAHPFLCQETIERFLQIPDVNELWTLAGEEETDSTEMKGKDMASAMKRMIESQERDRTAEADVAPEPTDATVDDAAEQPLTFKFRKDLRHLKKSQNWPELKNRSLCHKCEYPPDDPWVTSCLHLYCKECLNALHHDAAAREEGNREVSYLEYSAVFTESHPCDGLKELEGDESLLGSGARTTKKRVKKDLNVDIKWIDVGGELLPSSKTAAIQVQLKQWLDEEPDKKIIVFSQFHMLLKIVGRICERQKWRHCNYNGRMSQEQKDESLKDFRDEPDTKVMVASLKCGGIGLNLTMASKVICVDLWWNSCIEQQAFCRVFRIDQKEETFITRLVVRETIDEKLVELQKQKDEAIFAAIDDNRMLGKLSITNLMRLFGPVSHDNKGTPFIMVDANGALGPGDFELNFEDSQRQATLKVYKGSKGKGSKGTRGSKGSKGSKGGKGEKPASGKGSRGGRGARAAKVRKDDADLEAIERDITGFGHVERDIADLDAET